MSDTENAAEQSKDPWWKQILWGLFFFVMSGFLWWFFTDLEESGGRKRINAIVALLYNTLGKVPTVALFALIGVVFIALGIRDKLKAPQTS